MCLAISGGQLVKEACKAVKVTPDQIRDWAASSPEFSALYARAREQQAHAIAEQALAIADSDAFTKEEVARNKLRVDTRKWLASKIAPRLYGERTQHEVTGTDGAPIQHEHRVIQWGGIEVPL